MQSSVPLIADGPDCAATTDLVASLLAIGCPMVPTANKLCIDDRTGKREYTFHMGCEFLLNGPEPVRTRALINSFKSGDLEKTDPAHPLLDCLRGLHNSHALLDWIKCGEARHLAWAANRSRMSYVPGAQRVPEGITLDAANLTGTKSLAEAAALGVVGIPIARIEGADHHAFIVPKRGFAIHRDNDEWHPYGAVELMSRLRDGTLIKENPEHPFLYAYYAGKWSEALMKHLDQEVPLILLRPKGTLKSALIAQNATDEAWQQADEHLESD